MNTPDNITELRDNEIFVFGSHESGHHAGGAARYAVNNFGAIVGQGEGPQGQSYALPTMGSPEELEVAVGRFLWFANTRRDLTFLVTKVGTGIAGLKVEDVAPLFKDRSPNVVLPIEFEAFA
ncbi:MAG TPA: hypothetical protein VGI56_12455 [Galbitalea sp.]